MTAEEKQQLKDKIVKNIAELKENIINLEELTKPIAPENSIGRISRMEAINSKSVNEAALRESKSKLNRLQAALGKIDEESFGKCISCKDDIPLPRLMFMPESSRCVKCASK